MNFNSMLIGSENPKRLIDFYTKALGEPAYSDDSYSGWQIGSGSTEVRETFERMKAAGATVIAEPYGFDDYPGVLIATLADPDGNYFQLQTPMMPEVQATEK